MKTRYFDLGDWLRQFTWHLAATRHHALSLGWPKTTALWVLAGQRRRDAPDVVMLYDAPELRAKLLYAPELAHLFEAACTAPQDQVVCVAQHDPAQCLTDPRRRYAIHTFDASTYPALPDHIVCILNHTMQKLELWNPLDDIAEFDDGAADAAAE